MDEVKTIEENHGEEIRHYIKNGVASRLASRLYGVIYAFAASEPEGVTWAEIDIALFAAHDAIRRYSKADQAARTEEECNEKSSNSVYPTGVD